MKSTNSFATGFSLSNMLYHKIMFDLADNIKEADAGKRELFIVHTGDLVGAEGNTWNLIDGCRMVASVKDDVTDEHGDTYVGFNDDGTIASLSLQENADDPDRFNIVISFKPIKTHVIVRINIVDREWKLAMDVYDYDGNPINQHDADGDIKLFTDIVLTTCRDFLRTTIDRPVTIKSFESEDEDNDG